MTHFFSGCIKHVLHHLGGAGSFKAAWLILPPIAILIAAVILLNGCGDNNQKQTIPSRPVRYVVAPRPPLVCISFKLAKSAHMMKLRWGFVWMEECQAER